MKKILVTAEREYSVSIGASWIKEVRELCSGRTRVAVITSKSFTPDLTPLNDVDTELHLFQVPDGEEGKSISTLTNLWNWLGAAGFTRSDLVIGIGGGAITDLAGFAAASWLRGLDWVAVPTSLAGMVDASVGGKTGINSDYGKNLIGAFHSPIAVVIDPSLLTTLSDRDLSAGMAEVIKCGFIADPQILNLCAGKDVSTLRSEIGLLEE
jgi:3-dehydroquinate synthase